MRLTSLCIIVVLSTASSKLAVANGRPPTSVAVRAQSSQIIASTTFGLVVTSSDTAPWRWICETALGFGGTFDPDYELSRSSSAVFVSALDGLRISRDGCTFSKTDLGSRFISSIAVASNGDVFVAASDTEGSKIYRSMDDGLSFPQASDAFRNYDAWNTIETAPSDPTRIYISGIRLVVGSPKQYLLYRSNDSGKTFAPMSSAGIATTTNSLIYIAGISQTNPNVVFARVTEETSPVSEAIYRSDDAGTTWARILAKNDSLNAFVVRHNGDLVVGTPNSGTLRSTDSGASFSPLTGAPHLTCLAESPDGTLYGCTQNYGAEGDGAGVMKSTNGSSWSKVLRYQDIEAPVACAGGTVQKETCELAEWCGVKEQLGITSSSITCAAPDGGPMTASPGGCCDANGQNQGMLTSGLTILAFSLMRRRRHFFSRSA